jgi:hypothetical protein
VQSLAGYRHRAGRKQYTQSAALDRTGACASTKAAGLNRVQLQGGFNLQALSFLTSTWRPSWVLPCCGRYPMDRPAAGPEYFSAISDKHDRRLCPLQFPVASLAALLAQALELLPLIIGRKRATLMKRQSLELTKFSKPISPLLSGRQGFPQSKELSNQVTGLFILPRRHRYARGDRGFQPASSYRTARRRHSASSS